MRLDTECVIPHSYSICDWSCITSSPVGKSCLLAYTHCHKSKMPSLPAFAPLLHYAANNLLVSAPILANDKFNKIYPAYVFCLKLLPLIQPLRLFFTYRKTQGLRFRGACLELECASVYESEGSYSLRGGKVCKTIYCCFLICSIIS